MVQLIPLHKLSKETIEYEKSRKEIFLLEDNYNYEEEAENDMLNCFDVSGVFSQNIEKYAAFIQNVEGGVYIIIAKQMQVER